MTMAILMLVAVVGGLLFLLVLFGAMVYAVSSSGDRH